MSRTASPHSPKGYPQDMDGIGGTVEVVQAGNGRGGSSSAVRERSQTRCLAPVTELVNDVGRRCDDRKEHREGLTKDVVDVEK
jgi:hypothetical protein